MSIHSSATSDHTRRGRAPRGLARLAVAAALLLGGALPSWQSPVAVADTAPPDSNVPATVSTDPLPTAQMNGVAWSQVVAGNIVYVGGEFTKARPAGAALGTQEVSRNNLLAYDITTGVLTSFAASASFDGPVKFVTASPDGSTLYVAGSFTHVNGVVRNRVAAFSLPGGTLTSFAPSANGVVNGLAATETTLYLGGVFSSINGIAQRAAAAVDRSTGALITSFNPSIPNGSLQRIIVSPDRSRIVIGGNFTQVNDPANNSYGLALLDVNGDSLPMPVNSLIRDANTNAAILTLEPAGDGFYGGGYAFSKVDGNLEGSFKADWNGNLIWVEDCHGDTYSVFPAGNELYVAGHPHYCGNVAGFPQTTPTWTFQRGIAFTQDARGTITKDLLGYFNYQGKPRPQLLTWFPDINTGTATGQNQGPWSVSGNADYVVYGGEFTRVNNKAQQGLVRFARRNVPGNPNADGPQLSGASYVPTAVSFAPGIRVSWPANQDRDNELLTYDLIRNGDVNNPVYSATARSTFWQKPNMAYLDTNVVAGQSYTYQVRVHDTNGRLATSNSVTATANGGAPLSSYDRAALADGPTAYWPFDETGGTTAADIAGGDNATVTGPVTLGVPGAIGGGSGGTGFHFPGTSSGYAATGGTAKVGLQTYSLEAWFKTTSTTGGKIIGFGNNSSGNSSSFDRHVYLGNSGKMYYGVNPGEAKVLNSTLTYRDGQWHHMVATLSPAGQFLYVDGGLVASNTTDTFTAQVFSGYWRIGGDNLGSWRGAGASSYLNGDIDDVAVYPVALTADQVAAHYAARTGTVPNVPPSAAFTSTTNQLTASLNGSGSSDSDGSVVAYAWNFGDGATDTTSGASASHTYAAGGTYPVTLTVTDDDGATNSVTHSVVVASATDPFITDHFNRTLASGLGSADVGGAWTVSAASGFAVNGGAGKMLLSTAGVTRSAYLGSTTSDDTDLTLDLSSDKLAVGGNIFLTVDGRRVNSTTSYRTAMRMTTANKLTVGLEALKGSSTVTTLVSAVTLPSTLATNDVVHLRMQVTGTNPTTIRAKAWINAAAEPTNWTVSTTDSYAGLQAPGAVGVSSYVSSAATNAPITISVPELSAKHTTS